MTQAFLHHLGSFVARASQTHADDQQMQARLQQLADDLSPKQNLGCGSLYVLGLSRWPCSASQSAPGSRMRSERWGRRRLKRVLLQRPSHAAPITWTSGAYCRIHESNLQAVAESESS